MFIRIVALAVILQLALGLRKNVDIDVISQSDAVEFGKRNMSAQAVQGPFTQRAIRFKVESHPETLAAVGYHRFELVDPAAAEMNSLGLSSEWEALLEKINTDTAFQGATWNRWSRCDVSVQNKRGKELVAEFNKKVRESGKAPGWKLTFYTRFTVVIGNNLGENFGDNGMHYLTWRPETDNQFIERSTNVCQTWDRACCCRPEPDQGKCKYAWSQNQCCKFKYGNIEESKQKKPEHGGCKVKGWSLFSSEKSLEKVGDAQCTNGPEPPPPPFQFYQFVHNIRVEPKDDGVGTNLPYIFNTGKPLSCPVS